MSKKNLTPGDKAPVSGQYLTIGPKGGKGKEITSTKGKPLPPTETPGSTYELIDPTNNKTNNKRK